ncbi:nitrite transporter [Spizellomyces punctatus DAOM BR117]|uniref:Nitrate/nitrite transporter n=1 Tax=Spizellomyces punctatus (strain DAOM BR117) TaxID=645134 RepID=A0A0L0HT14_SPIPD|nr:nitrite transporter [Spizellomyces punctatus DAOM BR117]KND04222.1 nitrite transporter [Spizellomyces punctatus DAOM BR117]|eukprot:XP_016612261.1 nitrite transporter [Spizellomyces punctatus DAOM BR117]
MAPKNRSCPNLFPSRLSYDEEGKATNIKLLSLGRPHMRSFHLAWLGFFAAFTAWFALNPLLKKTIGPDLGLTEKQVAMSDIANVASTVVFRILVGPLVDKLGPRRVMSLVLALGCIPLGLVGLVSSATGLIVIRLFIGLLGSTFVACQYWTTAMFSRNVVGSANAIAGGWGNMGGGATYLLMPQVMNGFVSAGLSKHDAWRVSLVVPVAICLLVSAMCYFLGDDKPNSRSLPMHIDSKPSESTMGPEGTDIPKQAEDTAIIPVEPKDAGLATSASNIPVYKIMMTALTNHNVPLLMMQYACCFGVELAVDSVISKYFINHFKLDQTIAGYLASIFGMMNLFSRASGGFLSDWAASKWGMKGRLRVQSLGFLCSSACLIGFSFAPSLSTSVVSLVLFSYFVQAGCGSTFGIVPFVIPHIMGAVSGLVGAGGNIGGAIFNAVFTVYVDDLNTAFRIMGFVVFVCGAILNFFVRIRGESVITLWKRG